MISAGHVMRLFFVKTYVICTVYGLKLLVVYFEMIGFAAILLQHQTPNQL